VKQVQAMVRTIAKVRDIHIDERLNLLVVRDTPEVLRLVEKPDRVGGPARARGDAGGGGDGAGHRPRRGAGPQMARADQLGQRRHRRPGHRPGAVGLRNEFRASIANPAWWPLRGTSGNANILANPKIRVRNRDKAKVHIGQKLPVFTTTTNFTGSTSVAASVSTWTSA
jgi:general secretion pathway protein D